MDRVSYVRKESHVLDTSALSLSFPTCAPTDFRGPSLYPQGIVDLSDPSGFTLRPEKKKKKHLKEVLSDLRPETKC